MHSWICRIHQRGQKGCRHQQRQKCLKKITKFGQCLMNLAQKTLFRSDGRQRKISWEQVPSVDLAGKYESPSEEIPPPTATRLVTLFQSSSSFIFLFYFFLSGNSSFSSFYLFFYFFLEWKWVLNSVRATSENTSLAELPKYILPFFIVTFINFYFNIFLWLWFFAFLT